MSDVAPPPMVSMPAWWDPKDRTVMAGFSSFVPGLLSVDGESITFTTPTGRVFDCPLRETTLSMKGFLQATTCSFRITYGDTIYRIWLTQPEGARELSRDQLEGIERDQLGGERGQLEDIEGALDTASSAAGLVSSSSISSSPSSSRSASSPPAPSMAGIASVSGWGCCRCNSSAQS